MSLEPVAVRLQREIQSGLRTTGPALAGVVADWLEDWAARRPRHWGSDSTLREAVGHLRGEPWALQALGNMPTHPQWVEPLRRPVDVVQLPEGPPD